MTPLEQARDLAQQIAEFVGKHGSEDTATFLLIEAQRSLAALSAPQGVPQQTQALWDACKKAAEAERHACSIVVWMTAMESEEPDSDDLGVSGWLQEAERRVKHRTGQVPEAGDSEFRDMLAKCAGKARDALVSGDFNAARPAIAALASFADGVAYFDAVPLTAAPAAPKPAEAWQPIETAPKDGRKLILAYLNGHGLQRTVMACWVTDEEAAETDADGVGLEAGWYECIDNWPDYTQVAIHEGEPSHWMPHPAAPQE